MSPGPRRRGNRNLLSVVLVGSERPMAAVPGPQLSLAQHEHVRGAAGRWANRSRQGFDPQCGLNVLTMARSLASVDGKIVREAH